MRREWNPDWPLVVAIAVFVVSVLVAVTFYGFLAARPAQGLDSEAAAVSVPQITTSGRHPLRKNVFLDGREIGQLRYCAETPDVGWRWTPGPRAPGGLQFHAKRIISAEDALFLLSAQVRAIHESVFGRNR